MTVTQDDIEHAVDRMVQLMVDKLMEAGCESELVAAALLLKALEMELDIHHAPQRH